MRVLVIYPSFTPEAGAETSMALVMPHLLATGFELHLAVLTSNQGLVPRVRDAGVVVHDLSGVSSGPIPRARALRALVRELRPDLVHVTLHEATLPTQLALLGTGVPALVTWANTSVVPATDPIASWKLHVVRVVESVLAHLPRTRFHAVTDGVARDRAANLFVSLRRVRVAERGREAERYRPPTDEERRSTRAAIGLGDDDRLLVNVGRHEPQKGQADLIEAFDRIAGDHPRLHLAIVGRTGSATGAIEAAAAAMRHHERLHLLGHRDDVVALLGAADGVVCASYREGAAGALLEAMACGTPIVSVTLEGMAGVLEDGVNALVVSRDELADAMARLIGDPAAAKRRAGAASTLFHERFTIERSAEALGGVYRWAAGHDPG